MCQSIEEISNCRDKVIFVVQHLSFVISWKKSVLTPVQRILKAENQLNQPRNILEKIPRRNTKIKKKSKFTGKTNSIYLRIKKSDWFIDISNTRSIDNKITMSVC